jgi:hypothetical protein
MLSLHEVLSDDNDSVDLRMSGFCDNILVEHLRHFPIVLSR